MHYKQLYKTGVSLGKDICNTHNRQKKKNWYKEFPQYNKKKTNNTQQRKKYIIIHRRKTK